MSGRLALIALLLLAISALAWAQWARGAPRARQREPGDVVTVIAANRPGPAAAGATSAAVRRFAAQSPYPPGPWRAANRSELERVVLWPSHLLIRYAGVQDADDVSFAVAGFHSVPPPPTRTRAEALALARQLAAEARAEPVRFAALVREHSEDIVRREAGGSLGGIAAAQLATWPEVLDALSVLAPGEISEPVESWFGFHVLQRRSPPAPAIVTGRRIVIGHAQSLATVAGHAVPTRSRDAALQLARSIYEGARAHPERFAALVEQHSEASDRVLGGDFGTWSNREPSPFPREVEVLDQLDIGEVCAPFDTPIGFEIVQRLPNRARPQYAIDGLRLRFDPKAPEADPHSRALVLEQARALNRSLLESPSLLPELQAQQSRVETQFEEGRGSPDVTAALASVDVGQFLPEPVRAPSHYVIGRRAPARPPVPPAEPVFDLPAR
jgi:parvulin-like peptidyl-prolyl isomerase